MNRRTFVTKSSLMGASACLGSLLLSQPMSAAYPKSNMIKPKALSTGATIGLITPSSNIARVNFDKTLKNMEQLGFKVKYTDNMRVKKGFLAGTDQQRLDDLHLMFEDDEVEGIICARGGYGGSRLLADIDYDVIRNNPKVFVGYSDITALHMGIFTQTGLVTFHGPNGDSDYSPFTLQQFKSLLMETGQTYNYSSQDPLLGEEYLQKAVTIQGGKTQGELVGGNLTLISTLMGTPYQLDFTDKIVFLEDIGEAPYRIDRMFTQLLLNGSIQKAKGLALGTFTDCEFEAKDPDFPDSLSLKEVVIDRLGDLGIPLVLGLPFGHIADNAIMPYGITAELDADEQTLRLLESPVA